MNQKSILYYIIVLKIGKPGTFYKGLAVTSRNDVIDGRPPYWRYFFRAARDVLMEIMLENGQK
jgi:hypothetical protein